MGVRLFFLSFVLVFLASCANDAAAPQTKAKKGVALCPATVDRTFADALIARHAKAYGSRDDVQKQLPLSVLETATAADQTGTRETSLSVLGDRTQTVVGAVRTAHGQVEHRTWTMEAGTGVVQSLAPNEAADVWLDHWFMLRRYTFPAETEGATIACKPLPAGGARVDVTFQREELGTPAFAFDLESAALLAIAHKRPDGRISAMTFESWGEPDRGVRWPKKRTEHLSGGEATTFELTRAVPGLVCSSPDPLLGVAVPRTGEACTAPPPDRMTLRWPAADAQGRVLARVPFTYVGGQLLLRAKIDGRDVNALLDSGSAITAVDSKSQAARSFRAAGEARQGLGELPEITLGGLVVEHVPTASVRIPALEKFGAQRPEVILGYGFFVGHVTRVDYIHNEITFAEKRNDVPPEGETVTLRVLSGTIVAKLTVDREQVPFAIDTGSSAALHLYKRWSSAHGFPGAGPAVITKGALGPLSFDGVHATTSDAPEPGLLAGVVGNAALARCDAITIDLGLRTMSLQGSCARPVPER